MSQIGFRNSDNGDIAGRLHSERALDELDLANDVVLGYPADLTFTNDVHGFVAGDRIECAID